VTRLTARGQEDVAPVEEDDDDNEETRAERRREVEQEMAREERSEGRAPQTGGLNLLDLDDSVGDSVDSPSQAKPVLAPTGAGQNGRTGFGVHALLSRTAGNVQLLLTFTNATQAPLSGFAIQVNKNPFGLAPSEALAVPDIQPGGNATVNLSMKCGSLLSGTPATNPLFLQIAIKNSLDIFYFNVPFDLSVVLLEATSIGRDQFTQIWQGVGEGRQHAVSGSANVSVSPEEVKARLALDNVHYVAQRHGDGDITFIYAAATTTNNQSILCEVQVNRSNLIRIGTRTESTELIPLFEVVVAKRLGIPPP